MSSLAAAFTWGQPLLDGASWQMTHRAGLLPVVEDLTRAVVWAILLLLLGQLAFDGLRRIRRDRSELAWPLLLAAIFLLAAVLRLWLPPWAPLHANELGIADLGRLVLPPDRWNRPEFSYWDPYGDSYGQLFGIVVRSWHGGATAALAFSALLSALAVVPLGLFTAAALKSRPAGAFAAIGLALHPGHIALSLSESPLGLAGTLFLTSLLFLWMAPEQSEANRRRSYWAGLLALAAASELSVPTLALPLAALFVLLPRLAPVLSRDRRLWLFPLLLVASLLSLHVIYAWPALTDAVSLRGGAIPTAIKQVLTFSGARTNALLNQALTPMALRWLLAIGAVVLLIRRPLLALGLAAASLLQIGIAMSVAVCRTDLIRYQTDGHLLLFTLAAATVLVIPASRPAARTIGAAVLAGVLTISSGAALALQRATPFPAAAFLLVRENAALIQDHTTIHIPPRHPPAAPIGDFPEYLLRDQGRGIIVDEVSAHFGGPGCLIWLGPQCFSFSWNDAADPVSAATPMGDAYLRRECRPLAARVDTSRPPLFAQRLAVPFGDEEYLRVPGHPPVGLYQCLPEEAPDAGTIDFARFWPALHSASGSRR